MKTVTIEKTVYEFNELSESAKQKALQEHIEHGLWDDWYDFVYEDAKEIAKLIGIDIKNIYFSGFCSQGDGAQFVGGYGYRKNSVKLVKEYAPQDTELHQIVETLAAIQKRNFYQLSASVKSHGHYSHENCTIIDVERDDFYSWQELNKNDDDGIQEALRDFMRWIYSQLEKEYEYMTSEEYFADMAESNDWNFHEDGSLANS